MKNAKNSIEPKQDFEGLTINEEYAKKFHYNKNREAMEKAKLKYGKDFLEREEDSKESSEDDESEDSNGELINEKVMGKFIETYIKLKDDKMAREFLNDNKSIFQDEDFDCGKPKQKKEKPTYTIKDSVLEYNKTNLNENPNDKEEDDFFSAKYRVQPKEEKENVEKTEFLKIANQDNNDEYFNGEGGNFVDDGFLQVNTTSKYDFNLPREKSKETKVENTKENNDENLEDLPLNEVLKKSKIKSNINTELLKQLWGDDKNLDKNEKFLRNYILSEAWMEQNELKINKKLLIIDQEDEEKDEKFDEYEAKLNFRFCEEGGANITTFQRNIKESYRAQDDSRKIKRKEREQRQEDIKQKLKSELEMAKEFKKQDILKKIEAIEKIAGTDKIKEIVDELENEFDPESFDKKMNKIFNDEYYEIYDKEEDIKEVIEEKSFDYKTNKGIPTKEDLKKLEQDDQDLEERGEHPEPDTNQESEWFYCDECKKAIKENKIKYECDQCPEYITCRDCFKTITHAHKMKKSKVPVGCRPPDNWKDLIQGIAQETEDSLICTKCAGEIISNYYYICENEECSDYKFCKTCRGIGKSIHEHKLKKYFPENPELIGEESENMKDPKQKLNSIVDNVYGAVTDDIIAGNIATKFHYAKVESDGAELTDEMLLFLDDRILNKYMPLKKLAPYKEKTKMNNFMKKKMLDELQKNLEKKRKELAIKNKLEENIMEENKKKMLGKKKKLNREEAKDFKKKKRLETYGIKEN